LNNVGGMAHRPISSYMTASPIVIGPEESLSEAERIMRSCEIRHLPVVQNQRVVGLLSDREVQFVSGFYEGRTDTVSVGDTMMGEPFVVSPDAPLFEVASMMAVERCGSAVVVDAGRPVGVFTSTDALRMLAELTK